MRKSINAALNADQFSVLGDFGDGEERLGGIRGAGTNLRMAGRILDGDEETFWTPAAGAPLEDWWVEVDLGRAVSATEIAVKFARSGNPFSMFQVFVSTGEEAVYFGSGLKKYSLLAETTRPNTEYEITYPLLPQDVELSGRGELTFRQFVRFVLFRALRTAENPRLAEIAVKALGDNIVLGSEQRGWRRAHRTGRRRRKRATDLCFGYHRRELQYGLEFPRQFRRRSAAVGVGQHRLGNAILDRPCAHHHVL